MENGEGKVVVEKVGDFFFDHSDIGPEVVSGETELDKFFLFHKDVVGAVIDDTRAKDGRGERLLVSRLMMRGGGEVIVMRTNRVSFFCGHF